MVVMVLQREPARKCDLVSRSAIPNLVKRGSFQLTSTRLRHTKYMYTATGETTLAESWEKLSKKSYTWGIALNVSTAGLIDSFRILLGTMVEPRKDRKVD